MKHVPTSRQRARMLLATIGVAGLALVACGDTSDETNGTVDAGTGEDDQVVDQGDTRDDRQEPYATAELADTAEESIGEVQFYDLDGGETEIVANVQGLDPGFYGFHIHENGVCELDSENPNDPADTGDFLSAGGHLTGDQESDHPEHAGDLPPLLVNDDGTAVMSLVTDRITESMVTDDDGAAVMVHAGPDNFAHIPDRYLDDDAPDEDTLATGDAGERLACGVIE